MAAKHFCGGQERTLGTPAVAAVIEGKVVMVPAIPANPNKCPSCGTVVLEASKADVAIQARAWGAATITEHCGATGAKDPLLFAAINADKLANPKAWGL